MIKVVPVLPSGVHIHEDGLYDEHLDAVIPVNDVGKKMIEEVDGQRDMGTIVTRLDQTFSVGEERLSIDTGQLFNHLNQHYVLNYTYHGKNRGISLLLSFFMQYRKGYHERFNLSSNHFFTLLRQMMGITLRKLFIFWALFMVMDSLAYGFIPNPFFYQLAYYFTLLYGGLIVSSALHETIHVYIYRRMVPDRSGFVAADLLSIRLVRPTISPYPFKLIWVTFLGPAIPGTMGLLGILLLQMTTLHPTLTDSLMVISSAFALHLMYLLPFMGDGKSVVKQILVNRMGG
ncbi:hypothetical protein [Marininema halotolerans]|uniref:Uncharacterized protein n=1 Tax=Marininema halotolerans TaxID=1155944 RepID=A0A1I6U2M2_9BACL|nr:hypothetical protein [Marininema halotolerans]SFS95665.1 hypothetical protein SAMN05444972_11316 [Marininema halotolerans]